jgi:crotonobetainyl-CoA:carnitine CoA-transferase CaiB-like acyl-CoA transferase
MSSEISSAPLPLDGLRVIEFCHMVAGPSAGLILADLGADVIKVEPAPGGDKTRKLVAGGTGFFPVMNRNKRSILLDLKSAQGLADAKELVASADVVLENFRPGAMAKLGLGPEQLTAENPRLVYCSVKGFLSGPYEHRAALDEVVQMMAGLAYMTGLPGRPLRAGSSVIDIMGGMFAVIAIQAALRERETTGRGQIVTSALFETCVMLMAQHMMQSAMTGKPTPPMSVRQPAWGVYDIFDCKDGQLFVGVVTDTQWTVFCDGFGLKDLAADARLATNNARCAERPWLIPKLNEITKTMPRATLIEKAAALGLPYAPIAKPDDMFDDPHLRASGGLLDLILLDGRTTRTPALPIELAGRRLKVRRGLPKVGEHTAEVLAEMKARRPKP